MQKPFKDLGKSEEEKLREKALYHMFRAVDILKKMEQKYAKEEKKDTKRNTSCVVVNEYN